MELWVFIWTFSFSPHSPPSLSSHLQLLDAKTTCPYGEGEGGIHTTPTTPPPSPCEIALNLVTLLNHRSALTSSDLGAIYSITHMSSELAAQSRSQLFHGPSRLYAMKMTFKIYLNYNFFRHKIFHGAADVQWKTKVILSKLHSKFQNLFVNYFLTELQT